MSSIGETHRNNGRNGGYSIGDGNNGSGRYDHTSLIVSLIRNPTHDNQDREGELEPESLQNGRQLPEEIRDFDGLAGRCPTCMLAIDRMLEDQNLRHIDTQKMAK
jgi:bacterioferritin-associated ferredoxin